MRRLVFTVALLSVTLAGCWMFEKTDDRPSPFGEAVTAASDAYKDAYGKAKEIPIPGVPTEFVGIIAGAVAALASGVTVIVRRGSEKRKAKKANAVGQQEAPKTQ